MQREGQLPFLEIGEHGLAELALARREVEQVVDELEADAEGAAVAGEHLARFRALRRDEAAGSSRRPRTGGPSCGR